MVHRAGRSAHALRHGARAFLADRAVRFEQFGRHAEAARRRAARLSITREATGETAYAAGEYQVALHEFRALRRMQGGTEYLAAMADCERALGRPEKALKLIREGLDAKPDFGRSH